MELDSLTVAESVSLAVLLKALVTGDGVISDEENAWLAKVALEMSAQVFQQAEAIRLDGDAAVVQFLATVERPLAQNIIYDALMTVAKSDGFTSSETRLLDLVAQTWDIVVVESHGEASG